VAKSIWNILNIPASSDERTIKRAYASLLRANNPEDDPAGFQVLRGAYEQALQYAKYAKDFPEDAYYDPWEDEDEDGPGSVPDAADLQQQTAASGANDVHEPENCSPSASPVQSAPTQSRLRPQPPDELAPDKRNHQCRLSTLEDAIQRGALNSELEAALQAVVKSPAMVDIGVYTQTEQHILSLISEGSKAARSICDSAFQAFGWDKAENQGKGSIGEQAVWVRDRWQQETESGEFLERVKNPKHEFYPAWKEASIDPSTRSSFSKIFGIRHLPVVQRFFDTMNAKAPMAFDGLNDHAVNWLTDRLHTYLPNFRFIKWAFVGLVVLGVVVSLMFDSPRPAGESSTAGQPQPPSASAEAGSPAEARAKCLKQTKSVPIYKGGDESKSSAFLRFMATDACEAALLLRPNSLVLQTSLGVIDLKKRYFGPAIVNFQKVLDVSPNDEIALYGMALARTRLGTPNAMAEGARIAKRSTPFAKKYFNDLGLSYDIRDKSGALVGFDDRATIAPTANAIGARIISPEEFTKSAAHYGIAELPTKGFVEVQCSADNGSVDCTVLQELPTGQGLAEVAIHAASDFSTSNPQWTQTDKASLKFVIQLKP
jgi:hypothetical protein